MPFAFICRQCTAEFSRKNRRPASFCSHACKATYYGTAHMAQAPERRAELAAARRGSGRGDGYVKNGGRHEHRMVAEQVLGRPLKPGEIVAHQDGKKANNDPSNLEVHPSRSEFGRAISLRRHRKESSRARPEA